VSLSSLQKRFSLSFLISLNIHIALFLCFSPHFNASSFSSPRIIYYQRETRRQPPKASLAKGGKTPEKKIDNKKKEVKLDKIEVKKRSPGYHGTLARRNPQGESRRQKQKKNIKPRIKNRIAIKDRIFTPLENSTSPWAGKECLLRKGGGKAPSFLTGFTKKVSSREDQQQKEEKILIEQKRQKKVLEKRNLLSYYRVISEQIKQKAVYPEEARRSLSEGLVYISFTVFDDGRLKEIELKVSSGNDYLDKAALRSVQEAAPFPPFPAEIKERELCLNIPISFEIE